MRAISDRATSRLVEKAIQGDELAFAKLCEAFAKDILYLCVKIMGNKPDGEDAAQEAYIKMQTGITKLENPQAFNVWLHRVVVSTCNDVRRKRGRWSQEDPIENYQEVLTEADINALPQEKMEKGSERAMLMQAVNNLSDQYRAVVILYYYKGISQKEIADVMETSVNAVGHCDPAHIIQVRS
ncbi:RNA polymerase sigma factor [Ruminococcaceae bacterium OttesenSCG-928-A11]|nr:RNA polymerase sigma factor [Ruminococcaceae bacterium OttesenSCG-928-A11]